MFYQCSTIYYIGGTLASKTFKMPATFKYYIRENRPNNKGECPVYLRITCDRKKRYHLTGIRIKPKDWNDGDESVRRSHRTYNKINEDLEILLDRAKEAARELRRENKESASAIRDRLVGASTNNFFTLGEKHLKELELNKQYHLRKLTKSTLSKLEEFNGSRNLLFTEITSEYLEKFQDYLKHKKGNKGSTIRKNMGNIRSIVDKAIKKRLIFRDPFEDFEPAKIGKTSYKPKLTYEEIQRIEDLDLPNGTNLWHSRNAFILSFYFCGMRFGDLASLKWENVADGSLEYQMSKTGNTINIEIPDGAERILKLYRSKEQKPPDYIFPYCQGLSKEERQDSMEVKQTISSWNAVVNGQDNKNKVSGLKQVAKLAKIDKTISMHVARHSFAQHMAEKGVSMYEMMILLGHKSLKTTENYLDTINVKVGNKTLKKIF